MSKHEINEVEDLMSEEHQTVREVARVSGKVIDVASEMGRFIAKITSGPLEQASLIWEDRLKYTRAANQLKLIKKFDNLLKKRRMTKPTRTIPLSFAVPLLQAATLEEDGGLQDLWAAMLANAADECVDTQLRRAFVSILEEMTSLDVKILKLIGDAHPLDDHLKVLGGGFYIGHLPDKAAPKYEHAFDGSDPSPTKEVLLSVSNLKRLNLLETSYSLDGSPRKLEVELTYLGKEFLHICSD